MPKDFCAVVLVSLLAAGCHAPSILSDASREPNFESQHLSAEDSAQKKSAAGKTTEKVASTRHDATEENAAPMTAPSPIVHKQETSVHKQETPRAVDNVPVPELLRLAGIEVAAGRLDQAKAYYGRVLAIDPDQPAAHQGLGNVADLQQDFKTAVVHYEAALRRNPADADLLSDLGYSYLLQGRLRESEDALRSALRVRPDHQRALNNLGLLAAARGDYDGTFQAFRQSVGEDAARARVAQLFPNGRSAAESDGAPIAGSPAAPPRNVMRAIAEPNSTGPRIEPLTKAAPLRAAGSSKIADRGAQAVLPASAEIDVSNNPATLGTPEATNSFAPASRVVPRAERNVMAAAASQDNSATDQPRYWPPRRTSSDVVPAAVLRTAPRTSSPSEARSIADARLNSEPRLDSERDLAAQYRDATIVGLNAGPGAPFPVLRDGMPTIANSGMSANAARTGGDPLPSVGTIPVEVEIPTANAARDTSPDVRAAGLDVNDVPRAANDSEDANRGRGTAWGGLSPDVQIQPGAIDPRLPPPTDAGGFVNSRRPDGVASGASVRDPLSDFESEIKRRSQSAYSVERSFRTGTAPTSPRQLPQPADSTQYAR